MSWRTLFIVRGAPPVEEIDRRRPSTSRVVTSRAGRLPKAAMTVPREAPERVRGRAAFLAQGSNPPSGNANATEVDAIFWIETVTGGDGEPDTLQLQYTQLVQLDFNGLRWPHVTVATLAKVEDDGGNGSGGGEGSGGSGYGDGGD